MTHFQKVSSLAVAMLLGLAWAAPALALERFTLATTHTFPSYEIRHQGISIMRGKFNRTQGRVVLDPAGGRSLVDVTVDASSVNSGLEELDRKLRGAAFFNVQAHPHIRFVGTQVTFRDGRPVSVQGDLTMLGRTQPVTLEIRDFACTLQFLTRRPMCGADVHAVIKRSDFGMTFGIPLVGDEVRLEIGVEAFRE